jgi:hypothetical protein
MLCPYMSRKGNLLNTEEPQIFNSWIKLLGVSMPIRDYLKFQAVHYEIVIGFKVSIPIRDYLKF